MKRIIFAITICASLVSCGTQVKEEHKTEEQPAVAIAAEPVSESLASDAVTAATSPAGVALNGVILIAPQQRASVSMTVGGKIHTIPILPGQFVKQGSLLATLENPAFIDMQQNYLEAAAQAEFLQKEYERQERLSKEEAASQKRYQQSKSEYLSMKSRLDAAAAQLRLLGVTPEQLKDKGIEPYIEVRSPITGYISELDVNLGSYVNVGETLCEVIDKGDVMISLTAYEKDLPWVESGKPVRFKANGLDDVWFDAVITSVGQKIDETNRSLEVYGKVKQSNAHFRPGMYVSANIEK